MKRSESSRAAPGKSPRTTVSTILVVDDEPEMLTNYRRLLSRSGHECLTTTDPAQVESLLTDHRPDLVITDLVMPGSSGMDVLKTVRQFDRDIPVIMITAHGSIESAVEAMKLEAADYLTKPFSMNDLLDKVQEALSRRLIEREAETPRTEEPQKDWRRSIVGISPAIERVLELVRKVARTDVNVLITGESGTGKEVIARAVHRLSARRKEIFVPVDCASLPENLLESELFGYTKGAFTGATSEKKGLFEFAHKGTLFLDEIGDMPIALQSKLLRVLQERSFRRIGGREQIDVDVRVIAATNRDLPAAIQEKTFRSDLYYRLNVITLHLPPLKDRTEDIPLLANHFLRQFVRDNFLPEYLISPEAMDHLRSYSWPGNVRELQNVIEHAATLAGGTEITVADLPAEVRECRTDLQSAQEVSFFNMKDKMVGDFEREYLISLLVENQFNISRAAAAAGCHRRTLYRMIHRHNIDLDTIQDQRRQSRSGVTDEPKMDPGSET
jgi:DNA-binding NtrC family response regulator